MTSDIAKMPYIPRRAVERRSSGASKTFTIIFVLIIVLVAFLCLLWGFILPRFKRRFPGRPVSTRFNGLGRAAKYRTDRGTNPWPLGYEPDHIKMPARAFPTHPGVMARSDKVPPRPRGAVLVYNPRTETPFPNSPPSGDPVRIPCITPRPSTSVGCRSSDTSRGPFSPTPTKKYPLLSDAARTDESREMAQYDTGAGLADTKEYFLTVPEPLSFQPRTAGRPPPLSKQLDKFPMPKSSSHSSNSDVLHPNKLFANLNLSNGKDSVHNMTETTSLARSGHCTPSDITSETSSIFSREKCYGDYRQQLQVIPNRPLKSSRGDISTASNSHVHRAGTITRPRTPVAEYRELYERAAAEARAQPFRSVSLRRELTPSTEPLTSSPGPFSIVRSISTPPTSVKLPEKQLSLLPTPLRIRRQNTFDYNSPTPEMQGDRFSCTPSSAALPESPDKLGPLRQRIRSKRFHRKSIGFYHRTRKPRPTELNLTASFGTVSPPKHFSGESKDRFGKLLAPGTGSKLAATRMSVGQGSSRYSRDTKGMSIIRTPITESFSTPTRSDFQALWSPEEAPRRKSFDLIRSKIDGWDLNTADVHLDPNDHAPSLTHKRTYSDFGPRSPLLPTGSSLFKTESSSIADFSDIPSTERPPVPRISVRCSNDFVGNEHEIYVTRPPTRGKQRLRAEQSAFSTWTTSDSNLSRVMGKTASGNAEWI